MKLHKVRVYPSKEKLAREDQLAWKIAAVASDHAPVDPVAQDMVINRIIDNAAVALAAINRWLVASARSQALAHPRTNGAQDSVLAMANPSMPNGPRGQTAPPCANSTCTISNT